MRKLAVTLLVAAATAAASVGLAAPASADPPRPNPRTTTVGHGPEQSSLAAGFAWGLASNVKAAPPGANDWSCTPSAAHPRPVVLVHGTWANAYNSWAGLAPRLQRQGYCVFALNYGGQDRRSLIGAVPGVNALGDDTESGRQLSRFVDAVLASTGADQVDLVGHSQGVTVAREYLRAGGGADAADPSRNKVGALVSLAGPFDGSDLWRLDDAFAFLADAGIDAPGAFASVYGRSTLDNGASSPFIARLNRGGQTEPGVRYTTISTRHDAIVTPFQHTFLTRPGRDAQVRRIIVQDGCAQNLVGHANLPYDARTMHLVSQALDPTAHLGPAPCTVALPTP